MSRSRSTIAMLAGALVLSAAACGGSGGEGGEDTNGTTEPTVEVGATLEARVGPGFDISLTTQDGTPVARLAPGEYTIEVTDESGIHNFHLTGPGVDEDSGVSETGSSTWTVTFEPGTYTFICDPHPSMRGDFEVSGS